MTKNGYTLIELLVTLVIIAILALIGSLAFKDFSQRKVLEKETLAIQSFLKTAFGNATSGLKCTGVTAINWSVNLAALNPTLSLYCSTSTSRNLVSSMPSLQDTRMRSITGFSNCGTSTVTVTFTSVFTNVSFSPPPGSLPLACLTNASTLTIIVENIRNTSLTKNITITKGGAVDVQ